MPVDVFYMFSTALLLLAGISYMARSYFKKRVAEEEATMRRTNQSKRYVLQSGVVLALSVLSLLLLAGMTDWGQQSIEPEETAQADLPQGVYGPGTYKVGVDIEAGEYKLTSSDPERDSYYEIKSDVSSDGGIETNSLFNGTGYVTVQTGEYLTVKRATFERVTTDSKTDKKSLEDDVASETSNAYFFDSPEQEAEFFKHLGLTLESGAVTMQDAAAMSRVCGKVCPDVPGQDWGLQLEVMTEEIYALDRDLYDLTRALKAIPADSSPNIDFTARDALVQDMETTSELIRLVMTKNDWATWQDGWDAMDDINRLMDEMNATNVYTVPQ